MSTRQKVLLILGLFILLVCCDKNPLESNNFNPADEEQILFIRKIKGATSQICTIKPDGSNLRIIYETTHDYINRGIEYSIWSPDKTKILFEGEASESLEFSPIWILDSITGKVLYQLTWNGGSSIWSPDGKYIIFSRSKGYFSSINDLFQVDFNGMNEKILFQSDNLSVYATAWSKNMQRLLIGIDRYFYDSENRLSTERAKVGLYNINTKYIQYIVENDMQNFGAKWSKNENKIIYISGLYTQKYAIHILNLENNNDICISDSLDYYSAVVWSPNNNKIAFSKRNSYLTDQFKTCEDIFVMGIESRSINNITNTASDSISNKIMEWR